MASPLSHTHLAFQGLTHAHNYQIGIVSAEWNEEITGALEKGAQEALLRYGIEENKIWIEKAAGSFELPLAARYMLEAGCDAVICLGCLIKGDTPHFEYISDAVSKGLMNLSLSSGKPCGFGVITVLNHGQALERAGGSQGNKGEEAAIAVLKSLELKYRTQHRNKGKLGF